MEELINKLREITLAKQELDIEEQKIREDIIKNLGYETRYDNADVLIITREDSEYSTLSVETLKNELRSRLKPEEYDDIIRASEKVQKRSGGLQVRWKN